ncbi:uncharacterized protein LOC142355532 [Convolutriloba macropyga]|uniref:uncharacterized protein LOC142355532 n=1 Tax=Convolutriloba macropyga TaxID=536237 RepID=UPI003F520735
MSCSVHLNSEVCRHTGSSLPTQLQPNSARQAMYGHPSRVRQTGTTCHAAYLGSLLCCSHGRGPLPRAASQGNSSSGHGRGSAGFENARGSTRTPGTGPSLSPQTPGQKFLGSRVVDGRRRKLSYQRCPTLTSSVNQSVSLALHLFPELSEAEVEQLLHRLTSLLTCTPEEGLDMARRAPGLLELSSAEMAARILKLKSILPNANLPELLKLRPSLILLEDMDASAGHAIKMMRRLMPGTAVEEKLHHGGTAYWTFVQLL